MQVKEKDDDVASAMAVKARHADRVSNRMARDVRRMQRSRDWNTSWQWQGRTGSSRTCSEQRMRARDGSRAKNGSCSGETEQIIKSCQTLSEIDSRICADAGD